MLFIGIDPGFTGAIVMIPAGCNIISVADTPILESKKGKKIKKEYFIPGMASLLESVSPEAHVFIEKVHAMPGQGVTSMFNFGKGFGIWLGIIVALKLPYTLVTPQAWKKKMLDGKGNKDDSRIRAIELCPEQADYFKRKKDIGRADATLIAMYGKEVIFQDGNNKKMA